MPTGTMGDLAPHMINARWRCWPDRSVMGEIETVHENARRREVTMTTTPR
jgi:hypothetical protein